MLVGKLNEDFVMTTVKIKIIGSKSQTLPCTSSRGEKNTKKSLINSWEG